MYYAYRNFDINYNPVIHFLWAIYYCFVISQMVYSILISFGVVIGFSLYIKFRFKEVNELLKSNNLSNIIKGIELHKLICNQVEDVNSVIAVHWMVFFLAMTFAWDIAFYLTLYGQSSVMRIVMANCSVWLLFGSFFTFCSGAVFNAEAHRSYELINSFMIKRKLNFRTKWKVSFAC